MSLVLGLIVGLVIGFIFANNFNRSASQLAPPFNSSADTQVKTQNLPPNHPPVGTTSETDTDDEQPAGPRPQVAAAIEKAKSHPQDYEAQMTAGDLYYQIKRFAEATPFYEAAAKLKPSETEPMIKAGNAFFDAEKYDQAEKWYEMALKKDPKNADVRTDYGLTFYLREPRDIDRAIKEYNTALSIEPDHESALQNLALAYKDKNDRTNFQATLERLRKVNPTNPVVTDSASP